MRDDTWRRRYALALVAVAACLALPVRRAAAAGGDEGRPDREAAGETAPSFPDGLGEAYRKLSKSMRSADMPTFMKMFHLNFIFEAKDRSSLDRGPWRRLWLELFEESRYERVTFELDRILEREETRVVLRTRRVVVREEKVSGIRRLREAYLEDTWVKEEGEWALLYRRESEIRADGTVPTRRRREIASPRIAGLARDLKAGKKEGLLAFWEEVRRSGSPLLEAIPDDPQHRRVTFVWRGGGGETRVRVRGGQPAQHGFKPLERLQGSDLWYRTERLPRGARFTYEFHVESRLRVPAFGENPAEALVVAATSLDPLNARTIDGLSTVEMPDAPPVSWMRRVDDRPRGEIERHTLRSQILGERRFISVYTPPGYEESGSAYRAVFVMDGGNYGSRRSTAVVLDNLLAEKKVPPCVVFLIHSEGSRRPELEASTEFVRFLGEELVGWARENFAISEEPAHSVIGGSRLGGLLAAVCASEYPGVFGGVLSESGDFSPCLDPTGGDRGRCVARRFSRIARQPLRFYLAVGVLEGDRLVSSNQHLRDVLEARGYPTTYRRIVANHHSTTWLEALAGGLGSLLTR